jgi:hypothetical protein
MTESRTILHIGSHKTGTTFLQNVLQANENLLRRYGISYPKYGRDMNPVHRSPGHRYFPAFFRNERRGFPEDFNGFFPEDEDILPVRMLSAEDFWFCSPPQIERVREHFPGEVTIVCYLRNPESHIFSLYTEALKNKITDSFSEFVEQQRKALEKGKSPVFYAYDANLAAWQHVFPDVRIVPYCRARSDAEFMAQFFDAVGLTVDCASLSYDIFSNSSFPPAAALLHQQANILAQAGAMTQRQQKLVRGFLESGGSQLEDQFRDCWTLETVDLRLFLATFAQHNPEARALLGEPAPSALSITLPTGVALPPRELLDRFLGVLA